MAFGNVFGLSGHGLLCNLRPAMWVRLSSARDYGYTPWLVSGDFVEVRWLNSEFDAVGAGDGAVE